MSKPPLESSVEASIVAYAKRQGVWTRKFTSISTRGVPDRIFLFKGRVLFLEIKRPGGVPTALQLHTMSEMLNNGATVHWVDSVEKGKRHIDALVSPCLL